jgi:3-deoxy-7-phosphoheptulonate synthase
VLDQYHIDRIVEQVDLIQIGSRNMHNYALLKAVGETGKPVLLKRGMSATLREWILAAEYLALSGNGEIILCERGIRTFSDYTRNTLDLSAVPIMKKETGLPVLVDPSHGTGLRELVAPMSRAALACGADGIMVEVHDNPEDALSDGEQSLKPEEYRNLVSEIEIFRHLKNK